jgi:5-formyltetrahydrofolate cyclo-ligase
VKTALRHQIASEVKALSPDYCKASDEAICRHVLSSDLFQKAKTVFCYVGTAREIDTRPILEGILKAGKTLCVPLCTGPGVMEARVIASLNDLVPGKYNIPEPSRACPVLAPEALDLALVPCSTGNAKGQRLGYGGGFYDRYLSRTRCPKILLCRAKLVKEDIPTEPHDLTMDYFLSEDGLVRCES